MQTTLETLDTKQLTIPVEKAPPESWMGQQVPLNEGLTTAQSFQADFSVHESMYFLLGMAHLKEISKYRLKL